MQSRSLHPTDAEHKGFGHSPTSILQRKKCFCIDENIACGRYETSQHAFQIWKSFCNQDRLLSSSTWSGRLFFRFTFVEDEGWHHAAERYSEFLHRHEGQRILFLELGVGYNTPVIIKYPFWQMTAKNPNAFYACINQGQAVCPPEIERQSVCIHADIGAVIAQLWPTGGLVPFSPLSFRQSSPCFFLQAAKIGEFSKFFVDTTRFLW